MEDYIKEKEFRILTKQWSDEAHAEFKPICLTCARYDFAANRLGSKEDYMKDMTPLKEYKAWKKEFSNRDPSVLYLFSEYECKNGHSICLMKSLGTKSRAEGDRGVSEDLEIKDTPRSKGIPKGVRIGGK